MSARKLPALDVVGMGSMVVDRVHRVSRVVGADEKGVLAGVEGASAVRAYVGGVVLNHLGWAAALGLRTGICGVQADDENGRFLLAAMDRAGIERDIAVDGSASSFAEIFVDDSGERAIYVAPGATSELSPERVRSRHAALIGRAACFTTEVSQVPLAAVLEALRIARAAGIQTVVDLDVLPSQALRELGDEATLEAVMRGADVIKPARAAAAECVPEAGADPLALARGLRERFGAQAVAVTDGEAGCAICAGDFEGFVAARAVKAVDTTGAGDAFLGGLLAGRRLGLGWEESAQLANACGAACAEKLGAFPDDPAGARARVLELYTGPRLELAPLEARAPAEAGGAEALRSFEVAVEELAALRRRLDAAAFDAALSLLRDAEARGGRIHITGVGKPEHVARYAAAHLASTGTPAVFLQATECTHGSAGQVVEGDAVIAISNSGGTEELRSAVDAVRRRGARVVAVTGRPDSWLARHADVTLDAGVAREGGGLGLAPRASVAAELLVLASLGAALEAARGLTRAEYADLHPAGSLGRRAREEE